MRKIHLILRLFFEAELSIRAIARSIHASPAIVGDYICLAKAAVHSLRIGFFWDD